MPSGGLASSSVAAVDEGVPAVDLEARRAALAKLKVHPREADANRAVMARAERCYENHTGEVRDFVGQLISSFETVLDQQEPRAIETAREALGAQLDQIEGRVYL